MSPNPGGGVETSPVILTFKLKKYGFLKETKFSYHVAEGKTFTGCSRYCCFGVRIDVRINTDVMRDYDEEDTRAFSDTLGVGGCLLWMIAIALTVGVLIWFNS